MSEQEDRSAEVALDPGLVERVGETDFFRTLVENASDGLLTIDETSTIVAANPAVQDIFGYPPAEVVGEPLSTLIPERLRERHTEAIHHYLETGERNLNWDHIELPGLHRDGHEIDLTISFREHTAGERHLFTGVVRDVTGRKRREGKLERQRNELAELDRINTVIRDVNRALVAATTREGIERTVCERLADSEHYVFAWIGRHYPTRRAIEPTTWAGIDEGYLDEITVTADDTETGQGPTGRAIRTGTAQVARDIHEEPAYEPWREEALERGYQSSAAIPLVYGDTIYGALNLYSDRPHAFSDQEIEILGELGETIGLAINAIESKKLLHANTAVELELDVSDTSSFFVRASETLGCGFRLEGVVPVEEDVSLYYVTVSGTEPDAVIELVEEAEGIEDASVIKDFDGESLLLFEVAGDSIVMTLIEAGARAKTASASDGEGTIVVEVAPDADTRTIVETVKRVFPETEFVARREVERPVQTSSEFHETVKNQLTEKQRNVLEAAYRGGYFARPRNVTGSDLAESFDVTPSTFHHHLQSALDKVVGTVFDDSGPE